MKKRRKLLWVIGAIFILGITFITLDYYGSSDSNPKYPKYEMDDLESIVDTKRIYEKGCLKSEEKILFIQTGLGERGIESVRNESENHEEFLKNMKIYQNQLFYGKDTRKLIDLETGDVLVSMSQRFCFYPHGHAAIVVDGDKNIMLEARSYRAGSCTCGERKWTNLSSFVVLRLKEEIRKEFEKNNGYNPAQSAADYAMNNLNGLKYSLFKDLRPLSGTIPEYTQCAHLVWYAYYACGLDIDENRGLIIKPKDFLKSDVFDVVQVFGISPKDILKIRDE